MKKIIKYAVIRSRNYFTSTPFDILAVTTVRGRQVYGRSIVDDASTHVAARDVLTFVETEAEAKSLLERASAVKARHKRAIADAQRALNKAVQAEKAEIEQLLESNDVR